jgi:hypothetical protein
MKTNKELRKEIINYVAGYPNHDIGTALHVSKVGTKYVTLVSLYNGCPTEKITLQDFYNDYM